MNLGLSFLLLLLAGVLLFLFLLMRRSVSRGAEKSRRVKGCSVGDGCCGGSNCHKKKQKPRVQYFEDEELDRFKDRSPNDYTEEELKEWREVLETLSPIEVKEWLTSLERRGLELPAALSERLSISRQERD